MDDTRDCREKLRFHIQGDAGRPPSYLLSVTPEEGRTNAWRIGIHRRCVNYVLALEIIKDLGSGFVNSYSLCREDETGEYFIIFVPTSDLYSQELDLLHQIGKL